ncbi:MAG TPA: cytochrome c-type biogenesis protein, partial [Acidimicrobiales bacterium]|nr:cytochrome c-type biogenesis protein [Acidimicrobiales bacterium]
MRPASASVVLAEPARREPGPLAAFTPVQKNRKKPRIAVWLALLMVAGIALAAGAGLFSGGQPARLSLYERTLQIAGQYRCPVCEGETAAASQSSEAVEIRAYIGQALSEGHSPAQIRSYLMSRYGESILEKPPASGVGVVLWALPVLVVLLAGGGLGFAFVRWRRASAAGRAPGGGAPGGGAPGGGAPGGGASGGGAPGGGASGGGLFIPGTTAATGPVGTALYRGPGVGPAEAAAEAAVAPSAAPAAEAEAAARPLTPGRRWYRRLTLGGGAALRVLAAALFVVDRASSPRLPGDTVSGGQGSITAR